MEMCWNPLDTDATLRLAQMSYGCKSVESGLSVSRRSCRTKLLFMGMCRNPLDTHGTVRFVKIAHVSTKGRNRVLAVSRRSFRATRLLMETW